MFRFTVVSLVLALLAIPVVAESGDGGYAGAFMQVPVGARPTAMGGAYLAISNDGSGTLYNPAGLVTLARPLFGTSYRAMTLDRTLGYATMMFPTLRNSAVGISWLYGGSGDVERRNYDGDLSGGEVAMNRHAFSIIFAKRFQEAFSLGVKASYLHSTFAEMAAYSVSIDVGAMLYVDWLFGRERYGTLPIDDLQIGMVLKHVDASYLWNSEDYVQAHIDGNGVGTEQEDKVPMEFGLGVSGRLVDRKLLLSTDLTKNTKQGLELHIGGEYFVQRQFALRGGFSDGRLTAGTGYVFKIGDQMLSIDYAFSTDKADEGSEHIFSFDLLF
jgi:hypothetical protein